MQCVRTRAHLPITRAGNLIDGRTEPVAARSDGERRASRRRLESHDPTGCPLRANSSALRLGPYSLFVVVAARALGMSARRAQRERCRAVEAAEGRLSGWSVGVAAVFHAEDEDLARVLDDAVEHAVGPATRGPDPGELSAQRFADTSGFVDEGGGEELDHGGRDRFGKPVGKRASGGRGDDELVGLVRGHDRRRRTASTPRMTSPL